MATAVKNPKLNAIHYPPDRRFRVWIRPDVLRLFAALIGLPLLAAWAQFFIAGLPAESITPPVTDALAASSGFPGWLRLTHYVNFLFLVLLARSGLSILMDHPRLYWNDHCTPGTEWMRFSPLAVPTDRVWTAKDDARYISPWFALPGYRHTIGMGRHWHLLSALFWLVNGLLFVALLLGTEQWTRMVPTSWSLIPDAWRAFVHYATLHLPFEPDPYYGYNALQQLAYFAVVFIMAPLSMLTGLAMSPAIDNRFHWYPKLFGGRQAARSIHFLLLVGYAGFLVVHVTLAVSTGFVRNFNYIVLGRNDGGLTGVVLGVVGIGSVVAACVAAHWFAWKRPRTMQYAVRTVHAGMRAAFFQHLVPYVSYSKADVSPFLWPNGKMPTSKEWQALTAGDFKDFRLKIHGLVDNPVELSLEDMKALGKQSQVTMHHCIQGWSGIAQWGGLPLVALIDLVRPTPEAKVCVFHSFGEGLYGGDYYDTQPLEIARQAHSLLAYEMNDAPLAHLYGAPVRLRVESQLGYKMVKWVKSIEFVASEKSVGKGHGGTNEDDEYFDLVPEI